MARYPKIAKQLHLPFQSGSARVLKAMNRHYDREDISASWRTTAAEVMPELVLTSDVIVGFPGETEEEFEETHQPDCSPCATTALFTFIFSPRAGTPAAKMDDPTPEGREKPPLRPALRGAERAFREEIHNSYIDKTFRVSCGRQRQRPAHRPHRRRTPWCASPAVTNMIGTYQDITITGRHHMEPERKSGGYLPEKHRTGRNQHMAQATNELTPMRRQYQQIKDQHNGLHPDVPAGRLLRDV